MNEIGNSLREFGVAIVMLATLGLALWRSLKWTGLHVVEPVIKSHKQFLDRTIKLMEQIIVTQEQLHQEIKLLREDHSLLRKELLHKDQES